MRLYSISYHDNVVLVVLAMLAVLAYNQHSIQRSWISEYFNYCFTDIED